MDYTCVLCGSVQARKSTRGRKPKYCESCRTEPTRVAAVKLESTEASRKQAKVTVDNLMNALRANGSTLAQQRPGPVSHNIAELVARVTRLEERLDSYEDTRKSVSRKA